jgi:hypothetical protein
MGVGGDRNKERPGTIYGGSRIYGRNGKGLVESLPIVDGAMAGQKTRRGVSTARAEEGPGNHSFAVEEVGPDVACEERWALRQRLLTEARRWLISRKATE